MSESHLELLIDKYESAPPEFQATQYWEVYREPILKAINDMDVNQLRSGKYPILRSFGFGEVVHRKMGLKERLTSTLKLAQKIWNTLIKSENYLPYDVDLQTIREMAYLHCKLSCELSHAKDISTLEASTFGSPKDLFEVDGRLYSMSFLGYYIRYCFAHRNINLIGNEVIVELGSGSGHQIEILKKCYKDLTLVCFDLPAQLYLCETYLTHCLGEENIVSSRETINWSDLSGIQKGKVHFFGSHQFPLLTGFRFDIFWNTASFGEMEPRIVKNYLSFVLGNCKWIYLLQARHGKELSRVQTPTMFEDYCDWLEQYDLVKEDDAYQAHRRLAESGGYFQAVWKLKAGISN